MPARRPSRRRAPTRRARPLIHPHVGKRLLGRLRGLRVYEVDGTRVRDWHRLCGYSLVDFVEGGNAGRWPELVPKSELWVERYMTVRDKAATILHEYIEYALMTRCRWSYERAHVVAAREEADFRARVRVTRRPLEAVRMYLWAA